MKNNYFTLNLDKTFKWCRLYNEYHVLGKIIITKNTALS